MSFPVSENAKKGGSTTRRRELDKYGKPFRDDVFDSDNNNDDYYSIAFYLCSGITKSTLKKKDLYTFMENLVEPNEEECEEYSLQGLSSPSEKVLRKVKQVKGEDAEGT